MNRISAVLLLAAGLVACGGGGGSSSKAPQMIGFGNIAGDQRISPADIFGVVVHGSASDGASVLLSLGGNTRGFPVIDGYWSYTMTGDDLLAMGNGPETLSYFATRDGRSSATETQDVTVDLNNAYFSDLQGYDAPGIVYSNSNASFGHAVAGAGDFNGDGLADVFIGAPDGDSAVRFGGSSSSGVTLTNNISLAIKAGYSGAGTGDMNGDGRGDLVMGAPAANTAAGQVFVVFGVGSSSTITLSSVAAGTGGFVISGATAGDQAGYSVAAAGDVNGDGLRDVIVGTRASKSYVVFGKSGSTTAVSLATVASGTGGFVINGENAGDDAGYAVAGAGDVNGDGLDDVVVGAPLADPATGTDAGSAYVVFGKANGTAVSLAAVAGGTGGFVINGEAADDQAGYAVAGAGDVNGDGFDDVVVGAPWADPASATDAGKGYVVFGKTTGGNVSLAVITTAAGGGYAINGLSTGEHSGRTVTGASDLNGDGLDDVVLGAAAVNYPSFGYQSRAYVVFGKTSATTQALSSIAIGNGLSGFIINSDYAVSYVDEMSVAGAGDVNGDGFSDLVVGAPPSRAYLFGGGGRTYALAVVDAFGSVIADTLNGTAVNEQFIAGGGDDMLSGGGGKDVLYGGPGSDVIALSADNAAKLADNANTASQIMRIDGGSGSNTLQLTGAGVALDLTQIGNRRLTGITTFDLAGSGSNSLELAWTDLLHLNEDHAIYVKGGVDDGVTISGATLVASGMLLGGVLYDTYDLGGSAVADVWVQQGVTVGL